MGQVDRQTFARWLDLTMENRGISGRSLAKRLKVHDSAVSRWRSGEQGPSLDTVLKIAKALDVDAIRLAVTAGLLNGEAVGHEPLPMPEPTVRRKSVKRQIRQIRGLTAKERQRLIEAYDDVIGEQ
jgi:transcriptional regulator with XRE-family HTH domain